MGDLSLCVLKGNQTSGRHDRGYERARKPVKRSNGHEALLCCRNDIMRKASELGGSLTPPFQGQG